MRDLNKLKEELEEWQSVYENPADEKNHVFFTTLISAVDQLEAAQQRINELKDTQEQYIQRSAFVEKRLIERAETAEAELASRDAAAGELDYFSKLVSDARVRAEKAMKKFPQPNYVLNKVAEESGEVIKEVIHYTEGRGDWSKVEYELVDNLAMLIRLVTEGDGVIGFTPPNLAGFTVEGEQSKALGSKVIKLPVPYVDNPFDGLFYKCSEVAEMLREQGFTVEGE